MPNIYSCSSFLDLSIGQDPQGFVQADYGFWELSNGSWISRGHTTRRTEPDGPKFGKDDQFSINLSSLDSALRVAYVIEFARKPAGKGTTDMPFAPGLTLRNDAGVLNDGTPADPNNAYHYQLLPQTTIVNEGEFFFTIYVTILGASDVNNIGKVYAIDPEMEVDTYP